MRQISDEYRNARFQNESSQLGEPSFSIRTIVPETSFGDFESAKLITDSIPSLKKLFSKYKRSILGKESLSLKSNVSKGLYNHVESLLIYIAPDYKISSKNVSEFQFNFLLIGFSLTTMPDNIKDWSDEQIKVWLERLIMIGRRVDIEGYKNNRY